MHARQYCDFVVQTAQVIGELRGRPQLTQFNSQMRILSCDLVERWCLTLARGL